MDTSTQTIPHLLRQSRMRHTAIIGQAGSGKANLLSQLIQFDIENDFGLIQFDLNGDATERAMAIVPKHRIRDVVLIDLSDTDFPPAINPLRGSRLAGTATGTGTEYNSVIADQLVDAFKSIAGYDQMATPDMDRTIYNAARAVIDFPNGTILDMYRMLVSDKVREKFVKSLRDTIVRFYWEEQFARLEPREQAFITQSTVNKLEPFVSDQRIRNALGQGKPLLDFKLAIENRKIILIKVPQSEFGLTKAKTVAGLLLAQFFSIAQRRQGLLPYHVYLPDCQLLAGNTLHQMLATLGSRNISLTLSFQYLHQLGRLKEAAFGNIGNWVMFRVGLQDALELESLFEWDNTRKLLYELKHLEARIVTPFSNPESVMMNPKVRLIENHKAAIIALSRHRFARPKGWVNIRLGRLLTYHQ